MNNKIVKDAMILTAITLIAGLLLGLVHEVTLNPIATANYNKEQEAYKKVFADADSFEEYTDFDAEEATVAAVDAGYVNDTVDAAQVALDASGNPLGYVITVTSKEGSQANITLSIGVTSDGVLNGYATTAISETPGLGMKATEPAFMDQFKEKNCEAYTVTKTGAASDDQIDAISGATITSNAVTNAVNAGLAYFRSIGGAN